MITATAVPLSKAGAKPLPDTWKATSAPLAEQLRKLLPIARKTDSELTRGIYLDRLMLAESNGRADAKNPRSTALGAFQFIDSTWLALMRKHEAERIKGMARNAILALRTNIALSRRMANHYTDMNIRDFKAARIPVTYTNLRLAYLLGSSGATEVLTSKADQPLAAILPRAVLTANPFMRRLTAQQLVDRAARDLDSRPGEWLDEPTRLAIRKRQQERAKFAAARNIKLTPAFRKPRRKARLAKRKRRPSFVIRCNLGLASCRRWVALKKKRLSRQRLARNR